ncbi:16117_t:CDS:2 [Racocetra fulgida]|uniref:16117_t:CDS:1 n=1 Tax=Racocetra fulgida TaxID=60492 RepID=A0A9N8ZDP2_9GLOM|nr:16117_t:CDS:2 [Racocetra fulgida]
MSDNVNSSGSIPSNVVPVSEDPEILRRRKRESNRKDYQKHKERRRRNRPRISELREREAQIAKREALIAEYEAQLMDREAQLISFIYANGLIPPDPPSMTMILSSNTVTYSDLISGNEEVDLCESHAPILSSIVSSNSLIDTELYNLESNEIELDENHAQAFPSIISMNQF